jgi:hypothetical protein
VGGASVSPSPSPAPEGFEGAAVLPEGMAKAVKPFIKSLFKRHTVCSMANVRQWLQQQGDAQSLAAAALDDQLLHALLTGSGYATNLRRVYIARDGPHSEAQELRQVRGWSPPMMPAADCCPAVCMCCCRFVSCIVANSSAQQLHAAVTHAAVVRCGHVKVQWTNPGGEARCCMVMGKVKLGSFVECGKAFLPGGSRRLVWVTAHGSSQST